MLQILDLEQIAAELQDEVERAASRLCRFSSLLGGTLARLLQ